MMQLRAIRDFPLILSVYLQTLCLVEALSKKQAGNTNNAVSLKPFSFTLKQSCDDWVLFAWDLASDAFSRSNIPPHLLSCEMTYMNQHSQVAKLVMVTVHADNKTIKLSNLNRSTNYAASLTCNETLSSNTIQFVTGYPCSPAEMKEQADKRKQLSGRKNKEVSERPVRVTAADSDYSMMDMVLGVFLALCGVIIVGTFAYYFWKKRRRRQRIQRIFGQSHTEPFLALHTPSDQPTTSI